MVPKSIQKVLAKNKWRKITEATKLIEIHLQKAPLTTSVDMQNKTTGFTVR